jgi:class 3 adenylate cyclase
LRVSGMPHRCDCRCGRRCRSDAQSSRITWFASNAGLPLVRSSPQFERTLDQFSGDGIMTFFNDLIPCPDPAERGQEWQWRCGKPPVHCWPSATLGQIGFAQHSGYTAIGTVCNLAARLCAEAKGQIVVAQRVAIEVEKITTLQVIGALTPKGFTQPVVAFNVVQGTSPAEARSN